MGTNDDIASRIERLVDVRVADGVDKNVTLTRAAAAIRAYEAGDVRDYLAGHGKLPPEVRQGLSGRILDTVTQAVWGVEVADSYRPRGIPASSSRPLPQRGELAQMQRYKKN